MIVHLSRKAALFSYSRRLWYRPQAPEGSESGRSRMHSFRVRLAQVAIMIAMQGEI